MDDNIYLVDANIFVIPSKSFYRFNIAP